MKEEIFEFAHNNAEYHVMKKNNEYIAYKKANKTITYQLSDDELILVNKVFNKIKVSNNIIRLSNLDLIDKEYQHLYDKENDWHLFFNLDGSSLNKNEFRKLNMMFNYQDNIVYDGKDNKESKLKRLVNIGKTCILVLITSTALISPFSHLTEAQAKTIVRDNEVIEVYENQLSNKEKINNLQNAILNNKNLSKQEKEFVLNDFDVIKEHINYNDYDDLLDVCKNMKIVYTQEINPSADGTWNPDDKTVTIYNCKDFNEAIKSHKGVLHHELKHKNQNLNKKEYHNGFYEPMTSILTNEYNGYKEYNYINPSYCAGYKEDFYYIRILSKLVSKDAMLKAYYQADYSQMKKEMMSIINDESKYYELLSSMDAALYENGLYKTVLSKTIEILFNDYYKAKYNKSIYEDIEIMQETCISELAKMFKDDFDLNGSIYYIINNAPIINKNIKSESKNNIVIKKVIEGNNSMSFIDGMNYMKQNGMIDDNFYEKICNMYNNMIKNKTFADSLEIQSEISRYGASINDYTKYTVSVGRIQEIRVGNEYLKKNKQRFLNLMDDKAKDLIPLDSDLYLNYQTKSITYKTIRKGKSKYTNINTDYGKYIYQSIFQVLYDDDLDNYSISINKKDNVLSIKLEMIYYKKPGKTIAFNLDANTYNKVGINTILKNEGTRNKEVNTKVKNYMKQLINNSDEILDEFGDNILNIYSKSDLNKLLNTSFELFKKEYYGSPYYNEYGELCFKVPIVYLVYEGTPWYVEVEMPYQKELTYTPSRVK